MDLWAPALRLAVAPLWAAWERSPYLSIYREALTHQFRSPSEIDEQQWHALRGMLRHAYETTGFWRDRLDAQGVKVDDIRQPSDLTRIPVLTKRDLRNHTDDLLSTAARRIELISHRTSGSTGVSVEVLLDPAAQQAKRAYVLRSDEWSGWRLGERKALIWGNPEYVAHGWRGRLRNTLLVRACYLDTLRMDAEMMERFTRELERRPPTLVFGHAHSIYLYCQFVHSRGGVGFRPKGVISTAMVLHSWERELIEETLGCPVIDRYGCEEVGLIACQCEQRAGLHVNSENVFVEVLRADGRPAEPGEAGAVVVTDLLNRAMPIVRYQVGDVAVRATEPCKCGRGLPLLARIDGREADYIVLRNGDMVSGISLTENFAVQVPGIRQFQIIQQDYERFHLRIVPSPEFGDESEQRIRELVRLRFGERAHYECELLDEIPLEASGKFRFCISRVRNPFAACPDETL